MRFKAVRGWLIGLLVVAEGCSGGSPGRPPDAGSAADARVDQADGTAPDVPADQAADRGGAGDLVTDVPPASDAVTDIPPASDAVTDIPPAGDAVTDTTPADGRDGAADAAVADARPPDASGGWRSLLVPSPPRIRSLAMDGAGVLYAGADVRNPLFGDTDELRFRASGAFVSRDEGRSWLPISDGLYDYRVRALAVAGTALIAGGAAVMRSADQVSWSEVVPPRATTSVFDAVGARGELVMAALRGPHGPPMRSQDGGLTWKAIAGPPFDGNFNDIVVLEGAVLLAGDSGVWRSADRGLTFQRPSGIAWSPVQAAKVACDGGSICYASAVAEGGPFRRVLRSADAGLTWTPTTGLQEGTVVAVTERAKVLVLVAGGGLARSDDGGASWKSLPGPPGYSPLQDLTGPDALLATGTRLFAATLNGVFRSEDDGETWVAANGSADSGRLTAPAGPLLVDVTAAAASQNGDLYMLPGSDAPVAAKLLRSLDDGRSWTEIAPPFEPRQCVFTASGAMMCASGGGLYRGTDRGTTWQRVPVGPHSAVSFPWSPGLAGWVSAAGSEVWVGGARTTSEQLPLARSTDDGRTFTIVAGSPRGAHVQVIRSGVVLAQTSVEVVRSPDAGATWVRLPPLYLPVTPDRRGHLFSLFGRDGVVSTDDGATWSPTLSGNVAQVFRGAPIGVDGANHLYVNFTSVEPTPASGPVVTLFVRNEGATEWRRATHQPMHRYVFNFATDKRGRLLAATSGGVLRLEDSP